MNKTAKGVRHGELYWFLVLWLIGVGGAFSLALPFELLIRLALH